MALHGEGGWQASTLRPGLHWGYFPWMCKIRKESALHIGVDEIGLVEAKDGAPPQPGRMFGGLVACDDFQDGLAFLTEGGQRGKQAAILPAGTYWINTELFSVEKRSVVHIHADEAGLVEAKDGASLPSGHIFGQVVECNNFQDAQAFFANGGQKGKQLAILTAGRYYINTALFTVITTVNATQHQILPEDLKAYTVEADKIGIVTTLDGRPIPEDEIAGPVIKGHNKFQDGQKFLDGGGCRGLQEEVLLEGSWHLNPWFVRVEEESVTHIEPGTVGVVISYVGKSLIEDGMSQREALQFRLVDPGYKGVEKIPLSPNKYPINTRTKSVLMVPAHEITLNWSNRPKSPANYDADLRELELRDKDEFIIKIEVTQVISIPPQNAPMMISRIGSRLAEETRGSTAMEALRPDDRNPFDPKKYAPINTLVTRVLQPTVESYFRNAAQDYEAQDFREKLREIRKEAIDSIKPALDAHGVQAINTLIRGIDLPDSLQIPKQRQKELILERQTQQEELAKEEEHLQGELAKAQTKLQIARTEAQTKLEGAKATANAQHLYNNAEVGKDRSISEIDLSAFRGKVRELGPERYVQIEADKAWAKALSETQLKLPERLWLLGGRDSSGGGGTLPASAQLIPWIEMFLGMLRDSFGEQDAKKQLAIPLSPPVQEAPSTQRDQDS